MTRTRRSVVAVAAVLSASALLVAACSSDDDAATTRSTTTTVAEPTPNTEASGSTTDATAPAENASPAEPAGPEGAAPGAAGATAAPVAMDAVAEFGDGVTSRLISTEAVEAEASLPGETSGPAVVVTVEITNGTGDPVNLNGVTVDLTDAVGGSYTLVSTAEDTSLRGDLAAGESRTGSYTYRIPPADRADVNVRVKYSSNTPIVIFAGSISNG